MKIAVASGKGGTGKTTVATNLVRAASQIGRRVAYLDCDVEEPNGGIFLQPAFAQERDIARRIPEVDSARCRQCGQCEDICQFNAIVCLGESALVFPELCHSCGGCSLVCPAEAIHEVSRLVGRLRIGACGQVHFVDGVLNVGEHLSPPAIRAVKQAAPAADLIVLDAPPGTSCPAVEAVRDSDFVALVTEPTPFGVHDLKLAAQMVRTLGLPFGVVVNRADLGNGEVGRYCAQARIPVLSEIPDSRAVAEAYSRGDLAYDAVSGCAERFGALLHKLETAARAARGTGSRPSDRHVRRENESP